MTRVDCRGYGTAFDTNRDARGSSERCPSCGTTADVDEGSAEGTTEEIGAPAGSRVRITIEIGPAE